MPDIPRFDLLKPLKAVGAQLICAFVYVEYKGTEMDSSIKCVAEMR
jgi:hypothetical protein